MRSTLKALILGMLFLGTGLLTYQIYSFVGKASDTYQFVLQFLPGLPFGIACSLRFMHPRTRIFWAVLLDCIAWDVAFRIGLTAAGDHMIPYVNTLVAGIVGALGVTAATGLACKPCLTRRVLIGSAVAGALGGIPFGLVVGRSPQENLILAMSFPLWQVLVGLWIGMNVQQSPAG